MKKKAVKFFVVVVMLFACNMLFVSANANSDIRVIVNGEEIVFEGQGPVIIDGRTLVPVRGVFEALGYGVIWSEDSPRVVFTNAGGLHVVTIFLNFPEFNANRRNYAWEVEPRIINGRVMVPLRQPIEAIGGQLDWDANTRTIVVNAPHLQNAPPAEVMPEVATVCLLTPVVERPSIQAGIGIYAALEQLPLWYAHFERYGEMQIERAIHDRINEVRVEHGLREVDRCQTFASAAALRTAYLATSDFRGGGPHTFGSFESHQLGGVGIFFVGPFRASRFTCVYELADYYVRAWMGSEGHRNWILSPGATRIGVGAALNPNSGDLLVYVYF